MTDYEAVLKKYWGYAGFRGIQKEIIESIGQGKDTLGLMPTGGGKSITFQVPALTKPGLCLVITPLIALMKDQVINLRERGIRATAVYSGMTREEIIVALENCIFGDYKFLYISPERLSSEIFLIKLRKMNVNMITVDESHCISQWGYDFRPAYLQIADIRHRLPGVPVLALTATATPEVVEDIQGRLEFKEENVFSMSFERKNIAYVVRQTADKEQELLHILQSLPGSAIVYTRNRKKTREIAQMLVKQGITAEFYHAGLTNVEKDLRQKRWQQGTSRVMVATNAFGMGIDKPDVRMVIHADVPDSMEAYFQEAGRAGRDGLNAYAVLLATQKDPSLLRRRVAETFPERAFIQKVYEDVNYYFQMAMGDGEGCTREFNFEEFCVRFKHFPVQTDSALRILTRAGYIEYIDEQDNASRLIFTLRRDELYRLHDEDTTSDRLIQTVLRCYGGLFSDYVFIEEALIAHQANMTEHEVYEGLTSLSRRGIVHYIPHKKTPYIRYTQKRIETEKIFISPQIYEDRKVRYVKRIEAMVNYLTDTHECRSRLLLRYFGEENNHRCKKCDTCLSNLPNSSFRRWEYEEMAERILVRLMNGKHYDPELLVTLEVEAIPTSSPIDREKLIELLRDMLSEELIAYKEGKIYLTEKRIKERLEQQQSKKKV